MVVVDWLLHNILNIIAVCIAFGFIITIHELGHFMMARRVGIRCPMFAIGFGPRLFSFNYRGTLFSVCLLPLGGYVMMLGEDPESDETQDDFKMVSQYLPDNVLPASRDDVVKALEGKEAEVPEEEKGLFASVLGHVRYLPDRLYNTCRELEGNFNDKTIPQRMAVVVGGVTMNFISALILFWIIGSIYGLVDLTPNSLPVVMKVFADSPAAAAGLAYGDRIESVDGKTVVSGSDMVKALGAHPGQKVDITAKRGNESLNFEITPNALVGSMTFHPSKVVKGLPQVVEANSFGQGEAVSNIANGDVIEAVDGKPVHSFADFMTTMKDLGASSVAAEAAKSSKQADGSKVVKIEPVKVAFSVVGKPSPVEVAMLPSEIAPVGKIGIMPAQVTEFKFIDKTTNDVSAVAPGSIAATAGFQPGDTIYLLNGALVADVTSLDKLLASLATSQDPLTFDLARGEQHVQLVVPAGQVDTAKLGLTLKPITFGLVVKKSFVLIGRLTIAPIVIVQQMASKMLSPELVKASMSGPLGIMQMIFELSNDGVGKFLYIVALINAAVGAFNVIPFPALDGARLLVLLIGGIRGRELDYRKEAMVHQVGLFVLLGFVLLVTVLDIQRLFAGVPLTK